MDFTECPERHHTTGSDNEKFYSMMSPIQITESAFNQFVNLTQDIDSKLYLNQSEKQSNKSSSKSRDNKMFPNYPDRTPQHPPANKLPVTHTYYASLEKKNSYSSSKEIKNSPSKVSLLQNSLKLSNSGEQEHPCINQAEISKGQVKSTKAYDPSIEKTQMSDKFAFPPPSISVSTVKKSQSKDKKNANKNFRIQRPDQVYDQLEQQKKISTQDEKSKIDTKKIVDENISNKKNMLSENNKAVINSALSTKVLGKLQQTPNPSEGKPQQLKNMQKFTSNCLFRLPSSTLIPKQIIHSSDINNDFYHKYPFELTKSQLIINSLYNIPFTHITKIKIIYNQYNRPEIKITYSENEQAEIRSSEKSTASYRDTKKQLEGQNEGQLVAFICECYETIYGIFSWIIFYKLVAMLGGKFDYLITKEAKSLSKKDGNQKVNLDMNFNYSIQGIIFKKSKYLKNWDKRYVRIQNFILKSYRSPPSPAKQEKGKGKAKQEDTGECTFELSNIKELWTRFETLEEKYLVLKIFKKNRIEKFEFAINLMNFCDFLGKDNWLFAFVGMLKGEM